VNPRLKSRLLYAGCIAAAVYFGWLIAHGAYLLPALAGVVALAAILVWLTRLPADVILLGLLLIGYIVGNRGFAQLMPLPGLPLFPAEFVLAVGVGWLAVQSALRRALPWRHDALNGTILLWLVLGTARVAIDVRHFGLLAIRDYAMVYYAAFFFLAQHCGAQVRTRRYLVGCLMLAVTALLPVFFLFSEFPLFFFFKLTVRGVPLIYLKGDLVYTFFAAGSVIIFHAVRGLHRYWGWPLAAVLFLMVGAADSRAALVGLVVAMLWLTVTRRWAFPAVQAGTAAVVLVAVAALAHSGTSSWARDELNGISERIASVTDVTGTHSYNSAEGLSRSDNNQFRLVWWRTVLEETWAGGPALGLGFGYDIGANFAQIYDPTAEEFTGRSPHSIVISTIGRMGGVGLAVLLAVVAAMAVRTWRALRNPATDPTAIGLWCAAWVIFTSACFGVVLEGPMGAVVFWSLLGLANGVPAAAAVAEVSSANAQGPKAIGVLEVQVEP
jgi:O-antigen ligase